MQRKKFITATLLAMPTLLWAKNALAKTKLATDTEPFIVDAGKSRFGEVVKFLGVHPNDLKISSKDTNGQLSVFEYTGLGKVGPMLHIHFDQDEIFTVIEGQYRFVVGNEMHVLTKGQTIFLPRNVAHTWIQLTDRGKLIYFLQPAGKMEEFFSYMNNLKAKPSQEQMDQIHAEHGMKVVGPPLTL
ncbi:MAG: cupin domain-containing protein [Chitinophagaceae bacterium]|nr:cupin domain-containing protein [Chitinophagaceae bacterium]